MKKYFNIYKIPLIFSSIFYILEAGGIILSTYFMGRVVDYAILANMGKVIEFTLYAVLCCFSLLLTGYLAKKLNLKYYTGIINEIRHDLLNSYYKRRTINFKEKENAYYINILTQDIDMLRTSYLSRIPLGINIVAQLLFAGALLFKISYFLFIISLILSVFPFLISKAFGNAIQKRRTKVSHQNELYLSSVSEAIQGYDTIKSTNNINPFLEKLEVKSISLNKALTLDILIRELSNQTIWVLSSMAQMVCIGLGAYLIIEKIITVGMLIASVTLIANVSGGINNLIENYLERKSMKRIIAKILGELNVKVETANSELKSNPLLNIEYSNVSFGFNEISLYKNLNITFESGKCYAIIGESGSGKSTLMKLLLKYHDNYDGIIKIGNRDIRDLTEIEIFNKVSVVQQSPFLFNASLYDNISIFDTNLNKNSEEYYNLIEKVNLRLLAQNVGDKPLGDFGNSISGGERQRIAIARILRKNPEIIIFDEPTTGLDPENTKMVNEIIFSLKGITRIVINHNWDKEYLERFDKVIKL